ncbi:hypothetical protein SAMN05216428_102389 [Nitrosospira sp. Nsp11]|uniref:hypothetical protein n=1 Tax=Nitrosospira sp. Nsp11 TaxID=1855338 RepID=UPI00092338AD|nr:hypothetical protein [Nitrosospira sp. Nsp11]SHL43225.1 hypothetical protein SAMN05216428_102389 [Nitrosospira sp. Nsp11]
MAIDLGSSNTTRYHSLADHADFSLPNADWTWLALVYPESTADIKYLISTGLYGNPASFNLFVYNTAAGKGAGLKVESGYPELATTTPVAHDKWNWLYATRRSGQMYVGQIGLGDSSAIESTGTANFGSSDSSVGPYIGSRSDLTANRMWKGRWGQVSFISGSGLTAAQAVELANGAPILGMHFAPNIKFLLHGRTASATAIIDIVGGKTATRFGTTYGTNEEDTQTPYIWAPQYIRSIASAGAAVTGTVAYTNVNDTSSASGTTTITGSVAATNANDTSAAYGTTTVTGSSATTNANDTVSATGSPVIVGTSATTNANDACSASGVVGSAVTGSVAYTNIDDTASASGTTTVTGSVAASNANDTSSASGTTTVVGFSATTNADDICAATGTVEATAIVGTVAYVNIDDIANASGTTTVVGSSFTTNTNDAVSAYGLVNNGTIVEAALTTGITSTDKIKKPGIPVDAPAWLKTFLETIAGRRGNKITPPAFQDLQFSATPTKAECEALYQYVNQVRTSVQDILTRLDS